jgi:hypothetical protein
MDNPPPGQSPQQAGSFQLEPFTPRLPIAIPKHHPHEAAYCGLAAIALAAVPLLMAGPALQLAFWLEATGYKGFPKSDLKLMAWGGYLTVFFLIILSLAAVRYAARGVGAARRTGEPQALCDAGIYLGLVSALVWVGVGIAWHSQARPFL